MKKKKILMLVCMAVLAVTVVIPVNAAKKTNKKQIQVLNLYQDQKTDIEEAEYLVSYLEDKNIDEESVEKQEKEEWYIDIKTGKITKDSQYKRHFYNDGWTICIFRKNRALAPHERSAVPLGTDHCPVC